MRILIAVLSCSSIEDVPNRYNSTCYDKRIHTLLNTWGKEVTHPHRLVAVGDIELYNKYPDKEVWVCASGKNDNYYNLSYKTLSMLRIALADRGWDFLVKCDDDTYINFLKLKEYLSSVDIKNCFYSGHPVTSPSCSVYAAGGSGYILTRASLVKAWNDLEYTLTDNKDEKRICEDKAVGRAMARSGIIGVYSDTLFHSYFRHRDVSDLNINAINGGAISTHPVTPQTMNFLYMHEKRNHI